MKIIIDSITELLELTALIQRGGTAPVVHATTTQLPDVSGGVDLYPDTIANEAPVSGPDYSGYAYYFDPETDADELPAQLPDVSGGVDLYPDTIANEAPVSGPDYSDYAYYFDPETDADELPAQLPDIVPPEAPVVAPRKRGRRKSTPVENDASPIIVETHSLPTDEDTTDGDNSQTTQTDAADAVSDGATSDTADTGGDATEPTGGDDAPSAEQPSADQGTAATARASAEAPVASVGTLDLIAYVESQREAALYTSDSHIDVITTGRDFISKHGHDAYNALKEIVAPLEGVQHGKALPQFTPAERRLFRACMKNYPAS
ncbi:hypothetical protein [Xanthomonas phage XPP1]|uniref:Uncharacterized protein n=1 Tax=Xanthomonas phage XPP1 TaxID=2099853 RepID=A0A3S7HIE1_9CAUD|nr:hypothetical protein KEM11_gp37 [Xanthomonas phage XPP1]AVO23679.1 hypothetical protein [Xanthomonas phage XPP1]AVO23734.1 hypothetical protein [Xanthomonas phage XPP2]AVO23811.1 hypothetical protein [Xanthomonas phage XPP3]AVO23901.1 hypothetical protein [Xanthomonas phage XPP4]